MFGHNTWEKMEYVAASGVYMFMLEGRGHSTRNRMTNNPPVHRGWAVQEPKLRRQGNVGTCVFH